MCLADAVRGGEAARAYLVLGGDGWSRRDYFTSGALKDHFNPLLAVPEREPWIPYYGYVRWNFFTDLTVTVGSTTWVRRGRLAS